MTAEQPAAAYTPLQRALIMATVMLGTMIFVMNLTIVIVALPHMQGSFSVTQDQIAWVLTSFILALTIGTAASGWLSARVGRRRLFLIAVAGFTGFSFLCGTATTLESEVLFRMLQGLIGAPVLPLSQAIVLDTNPPERHGSALGFWGMGVTVGPVMGPIIGGWMTASYSWPWVFYFNVPAGIVVFVGALVMLPAVARDRTRRLDVLGFLFLAVALAALQLMMNRGQRQDWFDSSEITIEAVIAVVGLYLFVVHSLTTKRPFIEPSLLRDRNMVLGLALVFAWALVLHSPLVLLSLRLQTLGEYPVLTAGLLMAPRGLGGVIAMGMVGRATTIFNPKHLVAVGLLSLAGGAWAMSSWPLDTTESEIIFAGFALGFGAAFAWVPLTTMTFSTLSSQHRTEGVVFFHLLLNMGSGVGITLVILAFTQSAQVSHEALSAFVTPFNELFRYQDLPSAWALGEPGALGALEAEVQRQSMTIAFNNSFRLIMVIALLIIPCAYLFTRARAAEAEGGP